MSWVAAAVITGGAALIGANMQANAAGHAADMQKAAADQALQTQQSTFNTQNAQQAAGRGAGYQAFNQIRSLLPGEYTKYDEQGNPISGTQTGTDYLTHQFTPQDFAAGIDPGYAWRLQQGQMANQRAANIAGGALSGNTLAGLNAYNQGMASQEYGNAFDRYQTQRGNIYNTLASIAGLGQAAQQQTNQAAQTYGANAANLMTGSAAAQAAGTIGAANAQAAGLQGAGNAYMLSRLGGTGQNQTFNQNTGWSGGGSGQVNVPGEGSMSIGDYFGGVKPA